jgi:hypothetical protein
MAEKKKIPDVCEEEDSEHILEMKSNYWAKFAFRTNGDVSEMGHLGWWLKTKHAKNHWKIKNNFVKNIWEYKEDDI